MDFQECLTQVVEGACFTEEEILNLANQLHLKRPLWYQIAIILFGILLIGINSYIYVMVDLFLGLLFSVLMILVSFFIKIYLSYSKNINNYLAAIKKYYQMVFSEYDNFTMHIVRKEVISPEGITSKLAYLFGDGYEFYLITDFLKDTAFALPKEFQTALVSHPILKVFDAQFIELSPIAFRLTDILFYRLFSSDKGVKLDLTLDDIMVKKSSDEVLKEYVWIQLKNQMNIKLSSNAIGYLRQIAPDKEKRD